MHNHGKIIYNTNFLAEVPWSFKLYIPNPEDQAEEIILINNPPVFSEIKKCHVLNFYGWALKASAKNF